MRKTLVISAFPACGKTYAAKYLSESRRSGMTAWCMTVIVEIFLALIAKFY